MISFVGCNDANTILLIITRIGLCIAKIKKEEIDKIERPINFLCTTCSEMAKKAKAATVRKHHTDGVLKAMLEVNSDNINKPHKITEIDIMKTKYFFSVNFDGKDGFNKAIDAPNVKYTSLKLKTWE